MNIKRDVQARLDARCAALARDTRALWDGMIRAWRAPRAGGAVWLTYSANYLFNTGGLRWAVDPLVLATRVPLAPYPNVRGDLASLQWVLLTHAHADHADATLWRALEPMTGLIWVVPEHMLDLLRRETSIPRQRTIVALPGNEIALFGARILPFTSPHSEKRSWGWNEVPATGYLVEVGGRRLLFTGDVRTYDPALLPDFEPVDVLFAHLFLGRGAALQPIPPLLDPFVDFALAAQPRQVLLTHLYETARAATDIWRDEHAQLVAAALRRRAPHVRVSIPRWFAETTLPRH